MGAKLQPAAPTLFSVALTSEEILAKIFGELGKQFVIHHLQHHWLSVYIILTLM